MSFLMVSGFSVEIYQTAFSVGGETNKSSKCCDRILSWREGELLGLVLGFNIADDLLELGFIPHILKQ